MTSPTVTDVDSYEEYRREVEGEPLVKALKRAIYVLFVINTGFVVVDWVVYPEMFRHFLPVRIALDLVLASIYLVTIRRFPVASSFATAFSGGAMLFTVVFGTGGASSDYYVGLVLLFIGIGVLAPLSPKQGAFAITTLLLIYTATPFVTGKTATAEIRALNLFFLTAAAFVGVMSCIYLDRMRFSDFLQRRELERASEELKALDREKSRFTANMHHELRTPLTLMLAPIDAFLGGDFGDLQQGQRRYMESMRSNGQRLLQLINGLLDMAKIESGKLSIHRSKMSLQPQIEDIANGARPYAEQKGVAISTEGLAELPEIHVDREAIEKVLINLVGNALKFSEKGGTIRLSGRVLDDGELEIVVADQGAGLPPEELERIFDRFAQVDSSNTRRHEGTGIGLALAKELVELHGGRIWAESEGLGRGTQMHFCLPPGEADGPVEEELLHASEESDGNTPAVESGRPPSSSDRDHRFVEMRRNIERGECGVPEGLVPSGGDADRSHLPEVLVVDDNADLRRLLSDVLSQEFRVRLACNGREGLEMARAQKPELIMTDIMMPEMSGTELCREVKQDPNLKDLPVILVTSKADREMKIEGLELGADDYVTKPFHPRELLARARSRVETYRLQGQLAIQNALLETTNDELQSALSQLKEASSRLVHAERLTAVGELAAGVAHEINNPLNFAANALRELNRSVEEIRTLVGTLASLDWESAEKLAAQADKISALVERVDVAESFETLAELSAIVTEGLKRTQRLVGDLRDFAAPSQGRSSEVDVARCLRSTMELIGHAMREGGVELSCEIDEGLPTIRGEAVALNQVFLNLLKNAKEFVSASGGQVRVRASTSDSWIRIEVSDNGAGIAPEDMQKVFEPFFTTRAAGEGTGLGLSISRRVVMEHGGEIEVESAPGEGARFVVTLPVSGGDAQPDSSRNEAGEGVG